MSIALNDALSPRLAVAALIAANLLPLPGVLLLGWDAASLFFVYWLESAVVGLYNLLRMAMAQGTGDIRNPVRSGATGTVDVEQIEQARRELAERHPRAARLLERALAVAAAASDEPDAATRPTPAGVQLIGKLFMLPFFIVHYGIFMAVHLTFLFSLFGPPRLPPWQAALVAAALLASHGLSYLVHFIGRQEYLWVTPQDQMGRPYGRVVVMHLTILFGGFLVMQFGAPAAALIVLVALKLGIDLAAHLRAHAPYEALHEAISRPTA
jgi:hypothetical protein